jgi:hypothetical protein
VEEDYQIKQETDYNQSVPHSTSLYHYTYWQIYAIRVPGVLSTGSQQPRHEVDRSPPSVTSLKINGAIPPLPSYSFMVWTGTAILFFLTFTQNLETRPSFHNTACCSHYGSTGSPETWECWVLHPTIRFHERRFENFYWLTNKIFGGKIWQIPSLYKQLQQINDAR